MKTLELTERHKFQDRDGEDWYVWDDTAVRPYIADMYCQAKRLTDTELAAEVFSAVFHESECELRGRRLAERVGMDHPAVEHYAAQNREFARQAPIIERFATLPHYDEPQP